MRSWPARNVDLLLKAALLPPDEARSAWRNWLDETTFDDVPSDQTRLLAALSPRITELDPDSPYKPRIQGLARAEWTRSQVTIGNSLEAIDALAAAKVPFLVFKGAAHYAEGLARRRVLFDIDVLVPEERLLDAVDVLFAVGWRGARGESQAFVRAVAPARTGINLAKPPFGEIDLHRVLFHMSWRDAAADEQMWSTARQVYLRGRNILVPSSEIATLISLAHGLRGQSGDWVLDLASRIADTPPDWDRVVDLAVQWRLHLPALAGLRYVRDSLRQPVPMSTLTRLEKVASHVAERASFRAHIRRKDRRSFVQQFIGQLADAALRRRGFRLSDSDRSRLPILTPLPFGSALARRVGTPVSSELARCQRVKGALVSRKRLLVQLEFRRYRGARQTRFDICAGGHLIAGLRVRRPADDPSGALENAVFLINIPPGFVGHDLELTVHAPPVQNDAAEPGDAPVFRLVKVGPLPRLWP